MCVRARRARSNYVLPTTPLFLSDADVAGLSVEEEGSGSDRYLHAARRGHRTEDEGVRGDSVRLGERGQQSGS